MCVGGGCCQQTVRPLIALLKLPDLLALIASAISHCTPDRLYITVQSQRDRLHVKRDRLHVKRQATGTLRAVSAGRGQSESSCKETGDM